MNRIWRIIRWLIELNARSAEQVADDVSSINGFYK